MDNLPEIYAVIAVTMTAKQKKNNHNHEVPTLLPCNYASKEGYARASRSCLTSAQLIVADTRRHALENTRHLIFEVFPKEHYFDQDFWSTSMSKVISRYLVKTNRNSRMNMYLISGWWFLQDPWLPFICDQLFIKSVIGKNEEEVVSTFLQAAYRDPLVCGHALTCQQVTVEMLAEHHLKTEPTTD